MTNSIVINKKNVLVKEYKGNRVVTFKDIDTVHARPNGTAHRNFKNNRMHFIEGVDYFRRNSSEAMTEYGITAPNGVILVTESGYLMLVKSFTDDLAWTVQRELVNSYFKVTEQQPQQMTLPDYEYYDKFYKGMPVMTMRDFSYFTGVNTNSAEWWMRTKGQLKLNTDYFSLGGAEMQAFKRENPKVSKLTNWLLLITKSGFVKLCAYYGIKIDTPKCFKQLPPSTPQNFKWGKKMVVDTPKNQQCIKAIADIRKIIASVETVLDMTNRYLSEEEYQNHLYILKQLGYNLANEIGDFSRIKPNIVEVHT